MICIGPGLQVQPQDPLHAQRLFVGAPPALSSLQSTQESPRGETAVRLTGRGYRLNHHRAEESYVFPLARGWRQFPWVIMQNPLTTSGESPSPA
jgi:hypothetical protein